MIIKENSNEFVNKENIYQEILDELEKDKGFFKISTDLKSENLNENKNYLLIFAPK